MPTLVLDSGEALIESFIILEYLDELVGEARATISPHGAERRRHLRLCALATDLFGERIGHSDIAVACVLRFTSEAHPHLYSAARYPAFASTCEALPAFREIVQPLAFTSSCMLSISVSMWDWRVLPRIFRFQLGLEPSPSPN